MRIPIKGVSFQLGVLVFLITSTRATYWLNQFYEYDRLPVCAEKPISTIVRGMSSGCDDGGKRTSYDCFCSISSSQFNQIIATDVEKECNHSGTEVDSATSLFAAYCQLGQKNVVTVTKIQEKSENPTADPTIGATVMPSSTPTDLPATETSPISASTGVPNPGNNKLSTASKAVLGVCIPLVVSCIILLAFLGYRRLREHRRCCKVVCVPHHSAVDQSKQRPSQSEWSADPGNTQFTTTGFGSYGQHPSSLPCPSAAAPARVPKSELEADSTAINPPQELVE